MCDIFNSLNWLDPALIVALYAAGISTFLLLWNIYQFYLLHRGNLKIELAINIESISGAFTSNPVFNNVLEVTITKRGKNNKRIQNSMFVGKKIFYKKIKKFISYTPIENNAFPINILSEDTQLLRYNLNNIEHQNLKEYNAIRALIYDTVGKKYKSNWVKLGNMDFE